MCVYVCVYVCVCMCVCVCVGSMSSGEEEEPAQGLQERQHQERNGSPVRAPPEDEVRPSKRARQDEAVPPGELKRSQGRRSCSSSPSASVKEKTQKAKVAKMMALEKQGYALQRVEQEADSTFVKQRGMMVERGRRIAAGLAGVKRKEQQRRGVADDDEEGHGKKAPGKLLEWDSAQDKDPNRWGVVVPHLD